VFLLPVFHKFMEPNSFFILKMDSSVRDSSVVFF
jgi:hypothetical protein